MINSLEQNKETKSVTVSAEHKSLENSAGKLQRAIPLFPLSGVINREARMTNLKSS